MKLMKDFTNKSICANCLLNKGKVLLKNEDEKIFVVNGRKDIQDYLLKRCNRSSKEKIRG